VALAEGQNLADTDCAAVESAMEKRAYQIIKMVQPEPGLIRG
jgi:hypothetical protein